jgi:hypothetical protein
MLELIFTEIILYFIEYPGAAVRWAVSRLWSSKKTYKQFLESGRFLNFILGFGIFVLIVILALELPYLIKRN